ASVGILVAAPSQFGHSPATPRSLAGANIGEFGRRGGEPSNSERPPRTIYLRQAQEALLVNLE
ncbi:MAG TPA: hypothetical protein PK671_25800, partial [Candidatus Obscuribacter sp.]|nr:hypothetical protein [Candidatus Obscuribacter sp.]